MCVHFALTFFSDVTCVRVIWFGVCLYCELTRCLKCVCVHFGLTFFSDVACVHVLFGLEFVFIL